MQPNRVIPERAPAGKKLFRFWNATNPFFEVNMQRLIGDDELYLAARGSFNDPFDVHPLVKCDWTASGVRKHVMAIFADPMKAASPIDAMTSILAAGGQAPIGDFSLQKFREFKSRFPGYMSKLFDRLGICCFTEEMQNPIFWAHYAGSYTGVCAEFSGTSDKKHPFHNILKVHYTALRPTIHASQTGALSTVYGASEDWTYIAQYGVCTKSTDWSVEREWRWWLIDKSGSYQALPNGTLKRLFLGPRVTGETTKFIIDLARKSAAQVSIFETKLSDSDFRVERGKKLY
jgi:hypothetical protein